MYIYIYIIYNINTRTNTRYIYMLHTKKRNVIRVHFRKSLLIRWSGLTCLIMKICTLHTHTHTHIYTHTSKRPSHPLIQAHMPNHQNMHMAHTHTYTYKKPSHPLIQANMPRSNQKRALHRSKILYKNTCTHKLMIQPGVQISLNVRSAV